jgi:transcriptional regulator with XRE-family HTH domain
MCGLSQRQFAELIGVSHRRAYKYEHGIDSVSAGRLHDIARELNAPLESFFEGLEENEAQLRTPRQRILLDIVRDFGEVQNENYLEAISQLTRALARPARSRTRGARPRGADALPGMRRARAGGGVG